MPNGSPVRRFRFSMASVLLATAFLVVSISHVHTSRELKRTKDSLKIAESALGFLTVDDPSLVHAISLPSPNRSQWRWSIQLPSGKTFRLRYLVGKIPTNGLPEDTSGAGSSTSILTDSQGQRFGPFILDGALSKTEFGDWKLEFTTDASSIQPKIENPPDWLNENPRPSLTWVAGRGRTESGREPVVLLRSRNSETNPADGILVWIELDR